LRIYRIKGKVAGLNNNVGWIHNGNLSLKELINIHGQLEDIIAEINSHLLDDMNGLVG
jgi:hypothetical protein